jgi:thiol-disulfide isomerase/thioredoxin
MKRNQPIYLYGLLGLFVVLIGAFLLVRIFNTLISSTDDTLISYKDDRLILIEDWLTYQTVATREGIEMIYHYSETCSFCEQIRQEILGFAIENNANIPVYIADVNNRALEQTSMFAPAQIRGTPTVSIFLDGQLINQVVGSDPILNLIRDVNAGTFTP